MSKVFITGISGQDGSYLAEHMLDMGHEVHGMVRRHSVAENQQYRLEHIKKDIQVHYGDMTDQTSIEKLLSEVKPDYIFNLAAQSHVRISFDIPQYTFHVNALGVLNLLEAYRRIVPNAKFYQASSSEMFGLSIDEDGFQRETTPMNPTSPYGCAKVAAYNLVRHYRRAHGLHACNGILFNHESPRRGANFVTQKIILGAIRCLYGREVALELGNMDSYRDWGHSYDYVRAMWKIVNHQDPEDFVVSSMTTHSVRNLCDTVFSYLGADYKDYVVQNPKYMRSEELPYLKGDSTKARTTLGWEPTYTFEKMLHEMIEYWRDQL
jgi:GDPmannose 4,6-dehydratase